MSVVMFAEICDKCGRRSEEYGRWLCCRECYDDTCDKCDIEDQRDEESNRTLCRACFVGVAS